MFVSVHCFNSTKEEWRKTSLTFYGNKAYNGDIYELTDGTCSCLKAKKYGICYNNWCFDKIINKAMVAAINTAGNSNTKMCGKCVEMRCTKGRYRGLSNSQFGMPNVCFNMNKTIVVQITDSCPESHSNPSNKMFCNISHTHFDLSFWAFGLLAPHKYGVIDAMYRFVPCTQKITVAKRCCDKTFPHKMCELE